MKPLTSFVLSALALTLPTLAVGLHGQTAPNITILHSFQGGADGDNSSAGLVQGSDGNFYGMADYGDGFNVSGETVFKLTPSGTFTTLHTFTRPGAGEAFPGAALVQGRDGNFYGVTEYGGDSSNNGTVFRITPSGTLTTLHKFTGIGTDGAKPFAGLILGTDGNFYGTTVRGGGDSTNDGTVFRITPAGVLTTLHSFAIGGTDGALPQGGLVQGGDGNFYGTTPYGGTPNTDGSGTIYRMTPAGVTTTLHAFAGSTDPNGYFPYTGLTRGRDGNFYGAAEYGGSDGSKGAGTVFRITPGGAFTKLHTFLEGAFPRGNMVLASDGNFYGTTASSNDGAGILFRITPAGAFTTLHTFQGGVADGSQPEGALIQGSDGNIYGTSVYGGTTGKGTVYKVNVAPAITSAGTATANVGKGFSYQIAATNLPTSYSVQGLPSGLTVNTGTGKISGTPSAAGKFSLTLKAVNSLGSGAKILTLTVTSPTPAITSAATATASAGKAFSYQITATNSPTSYGAASLPSGLSINQTTGKITGAPTKTGTYSVTIAAFNAAGSGAAKLTLTVKAATPVITSSLNPPSRQGVAFAYQITATNSPTSYGASGLPSGLTINQTTGKISGMPTKAGTYKVTIAAFNVGGHGSATMTVVVKPPA